MFENLMNTQINTMSEDDFNAALGEDSTDKKNKKGKADTAKKSTDTKSKDTSGTTSKKDVAAMSNKDLEKALGGDDDDDEDVTDDEDDNTDGDSADEKDEKNKKKGKSSKNKNEDEEDEENDDEDEDEDEKDEDEKDEEEDTDDSQISVKDFLAARVELLIKKGFWVEWEGWEDTEWDEDTFAEIETKQQEYRIQADKEELLDSFGPYGRKLAEFSANGGDPDKLLDIFKEQQKVQKLSIETEDDQKNVVLKYATEYQKMSPTRAKKYVDALIADKELEDASKEAKTEMEKALKEQEAQAIEDQENAKLAEEERKENQIKTFSASVASYVNQNDSIPDEEKQQILKVLKYDKKLKDGTKINEFTLKFTDFRKNLPNYIELVRFVLNPKAYAKSLENKGSSKASAKAFNLVRTSNAKKKTTGANIDAGAGKKTTKFKLM